MRDVQGDFFALQVGSELLGSVHYINNRGGLGRPYNVLSTESIAKGLH